MRSFRYVTLLAIMLFSLIGPAITGNTPVVAQDATTAATTDMLNLRSGPSLSNSVILVIPMGDQVTLTGESRNGFRSVSYNGRDGWVSAEYLAISKAAPSSNTAAHVTEALNLRSGPSTSNPVIVVMPAGANVVITGQSSNGFLAITWGSYRGYASGEWITTTGSAPAPAPGTPTTGTAVTTDALNLRTGAGTSYTVVAVMPRGATVQLTGKSANGFYNVNWSGQTGWAAAEYLRVSSGSTPAPTTPVPTPAPTQPPAPAPTAPPVVVTKGTGIATDALNMRSGASTSYPVIAVIPNRARVELTGEVSGHFRQLVYNGQTGWAHGDWISIDQADTRPTSSARVNDVLNLRSGPATTYSVLAVMPIGAIVTLTGQQSNGFHSVDYNGVKGWAFTTYLDINTSPQQPTVPSTPVPTVPPTPIPTTPPVASTPAPTTPPVEPEPTPFPPISSVHGYHWTNTIIGPVRGTPEHAIAFAERSGANRMDEVEKYINEIYRLAPQIGFDPSLLVAQSALETGYWKSYWWNERLNPAGLSITGDPQQENASDSFPSGTISARAQLAHMHAEVFGDREPLPAELQGVDSSYDAVFRAGWAGTVVTLDDLAGTWAVDPAYGYKIARVAAEIFG